ncbi:hypothetical protein CLOM_g17825 [Closterium sp. NIES-68]|nr:hypothetical protein CLOM_g17825 [Closterium sp. NIES-68]
MLLPSVMMPGVWLKPRESRPPLNAPILSVDLFTPSTLWSASCTSRVLLWCFASGGWAPPTCNSKHGFDNKACI